MPGTRVTVETNAQRYVAGPAYMGDEREEEEKSRLMTMQMKSIDLMMAGWLDVDRTRARV